MGFCLQGNEFEELPEVLIGGATCINVDMSTAVNLADESTEIYGERVSGDDANAKDSASSPMNEKEEIFEVKIDNETTCLC